MSDESPEAKIARIDERTLRMEAKMDGFITAHNEQMKTTRDEIDNLKDWRSRLAGGLAVLGALVGFKLGQHG